MNRLFRSALVRYRFVPTLRLTPQQRTIHALQEAFYARYVAVGQKALADRFYEVPEDLALLTARRVGLGPA